MIGVAGFSKSYGGSEAVVDLSFTVGPGQILGLVGPNGAGKTTTLRALAGIIAADAGRLTVAGHDLVSEPVAARRALGYVPDDPLPFEALTVWEHLVFTASAYGVADYRGPAEALLREFELLERRDDPARSLSLGMRQKLAIVCAYLYRPRALVFDEPLTGLDPRGIRAIQASIHARAGEGAAVIVSSHLLGLVQDLCSHLLVLHRGRRLCSGPMDEILAAAGGGGADTRLEDVFLAITAEDRP